MINKYNESAWASWMIDNGFRSNRKVYELGILAKFLYANGADENEIKPSLMKFCDKYMQNMNEVRMKEIINSICKNLHKLTLIDVPEIEIYKHEWKIIRTLDYEQSQLLFTLLCMYKLNMAAYNNPYNNEKWTRIAANAKLKNKANIYEYMKELHDSGFLKICYNGAIEFMYENKFIEENPVVKFTVSDYDCLGEIHYRVFRGKYKRCEDCGRLIDIRKGRTNLCKECSKLHEAQKKKRYYQKMKNKIST